MKMVNPKVTLVDCMQNPEFDVALAARLCYTAHTGSELIRDGLTTEEIHKSIKMILDNGHESPLEHASFVFLIENVSRSLLAQITRHRIASFSVQSQRYVKMDNFKVIAPVEIQGNAEALTCFEEQMQSSIDSYNRLADILEKQYIEAGIDSKAAEKKAIENARAVLPNAVSTQMLVTMNARELRHFFRMRCCRRAQEEINSVAWSMFELAKEKAPLLFEKAGPSCVADGKCAEKTMGCGKPYHI